MKYIEKLRNSGLRPTKQRLQICEVLFNTDKTFHFTINELEQKIKKQANVDETPLKIKKQIIKEIIKDKKPKKDDDEKLEGSSENP